MKLFKDITGKKYAHWTVISWEITLKGHSFWLCRCICGKEKIIKRKYLMDKKTTSCGCRRGTHRHTSFKGKPSPTYSCWKSMIARCTQPSSPAFDHYRKRGITICDRWRKFQDFLEDMGERPSGGYTLDRYPDNDGNYEPGNVRWATKISQANNRVTNILFEFQGVSYTLADLARHTGVSKEILRARLCRSGLPWSVEGAIKTPVIARKDRKKQFYC